MCNILGKCDKDGLAIPIPQCYNEVAYTYNCLSAVEYGEKRHARESYIMYIIM